MTRPAVQYAASLEAFAKLIRDNDAVAKHVEGANMALGDMFMWVGHTPNPARALEEMRAAGEAAGLQVWPVNGHIRGGISINLGAFQLCVLADAEQLAVAS